MSEKSDPSIGQVIGRRYRIEEKLSDGGTEEVYLADPMIGQEIQGRYRIEKKLGEGMMGKVYLARQLNLGERPIAVKMIHPHVAQISGVLGRFRHEAEQLAMLRDHSRVVDIYDSDQLPDGVLFIVMEYVDGPTLKEVIEHEGALPIERVVRLGTQIAEGLREAHRTKIIHRDVKPGNVQLWENAEGEAIKILDFGIAKSLQSDE